MPIRNNIGQDGRERVLDIRGMTVGFECDRQMIPAVRDLSLHVDRGSTVVVVGESGSGKSVTSLSIMRLIEYGGGRILGGEMRFRRTSGDVIDLAQASDETMRQVRGAEIGMIFQEPMTSLNPVLTVGEQITEAILLHQRRSVPEALKEAQATLDHVRIPDAARVMRRYPHELSGGMRQRVMIAIALSCRPQLLIADEPTTALDVTVQAQILHLIRELQREMQMGVLLITHDMGVVAESADRVVVMRRGDLVEENETRMLFAAPAHPYTRALMAAVPKLGAMSRTDLPARFELVREQLVEPAGAPVAMPDDALDPPALSDAPEKKPDVVLSVRELVTRFDVRSGFFSRVRRRVHAVERVSFDLYAGETLGLVGESGCGKTTTGRSLLQLVQPDSGSIYFDGVDLARRDRRSSRLLRRNIQLVFQDPFASLNPRMRIGDAIMEPMIVQGIASGRDAQRRAATLLEKVGLDASMARRWPHQLSGGQRQRICIARALSTDPRVLVADESVSALDVSVQAQILTLFTELQRDLGLALLFITHDLGVVRQVTDRVYVLAEGRLVEQGLTAEVLDRPQHPYTRRLLDSVPRPVAEPEDGLAPATSKERP